jgi:DHA2 family multidrug resistance protein
MPASGKDLQWQPSHSPWLIAIAVMLATFMEVIDTSIASVAVPYIAGSVSATNNQAEWVLTVYLIANAVFLPSSNWFSEKFGRKRFLMASIVVFTSASFACGIAHSLTFILVARAVQGAGGGALQPISQAILIESFPPEKRGQALGLYALGVVVAPVIGPTLGGWLTDTASWRWAFYINIPIGLLALLLQSRFLEDPPYIKNAKPARLDGVGLGFLAIWSACLQFVCDKGQEDDWFGSTKIQWAFAFFLIGFALFILRELLHDRPLVDIRALTDRNLAVGSLLIFVLGAGIYSITTILPLFFQTLLGYDATHAGLSVSPRGLGSIVAAITVGLISAKVDARKLIFIGFSVFSGVSLWTATLTLDIAPYSLLWPILISGAAISLTFVPLSNAAFGTLPKEQVGNASGIFNLLRNIGGSIGISAANTIAQRHQQSHRNEIVHSLSGANPVLQRVLFNLTHVLQIHSGPYRATLRAYAITNEGLNKQAQLWAYVDVFRYLAIALAICAPLAFLLKKSSGSSEGAA